MQDYIDTFLVYLKSNIYLEALVFILGVISIIFYFKFKEGFRKYIENKEKKYIYLDIALRILYLLVIYLFSYLVEIKFKLYLFSALIKNIALLLILIESIKFIFKQINIQNKPFLNFIIFLVVLDIFLIYLFDISYYLSFPLGEKYNLEVIFKLLVIVPVLSFFYIILIKSVQTIHFPNKFVKLIAIKTAYIFAILVSIVAYLWFTGIINLNFGFITGIILIFIFTLIYVFSILFTSFQLQNRFQIIQETFPEVKGRIYTLLTLAYVMLIYTVAVNLFNIQPFINWLKSIYIVNTDALFISLYSLLEAILFFSFVLNLILLAKVIIRYFIYKKKGEFEPSPIEAIIYNFGVLLAGIMSLSMLGITWKVLLPLIGALGIGAGFGLQSIINNYISGFIIIFNRKIEIGDIVEIKGIAGEFVGNPQELIFGIVTDIGVINTIIETVDGISVAVPNSRFVSENIVNYTLTDNLVRIRIPFKISFNTKREKVEKILIETANEYRKFLAKYHTPQVWLFDIKDYYYEYVLVIWIDARNWKKIIWLKSEIYKKAVDKFRKENIEIPVIKLEVGYEDRNTRRHDTNNQEI